MKVQIYFESTHSIIILMASFLLSIWVGLVILFYTLFYQGTFNFGKLIASVYSITIFVLLFFGLYILKGSADNSKKLSGMLNDVDKGKKLPLLEDLLPENVYTLKYWH